MFNRLIALWICLLVASTATADTLVTWEAAGTITGSFSLGSDKGPPVGTPFTVRFAFDPMAAIPTMNWFHPTCFQTSVVGTLTFGNTTYGGLSGFGFTHAQLPGTTCVPQSNETQFVLFGAGQSQPEDSPWDLRESGPLELYYMDELIRDAFPNSPTPVGRLGLQFGGGNNTVWRVNGSGTLRAVDQPSTVPEPGTMTLFGIGLAAVVRRMRCRAQLSAR